MDIIKSARILAVDDDPGVLKLLRCILAQERYEMLEASRGRTGLEIAGKEHPDLILLDINLPDISGFDICRKLKADEDTRSIPVIFLTAEEQEETESRGFGEGATDFLRKPISRARLCVRVKNALEIKFAKEKLELQARDLEKTNERLKESLVMQEQVRRNLLQRDQILCAVNYVAKSFLKTSHWQNIIGDVLSCLGKTVNCEHVYFRIFNLGVGEEQNYDWSMLSRKPACSSIDLLTAWRQPAALLKTGSPLIGTDRSLPTHILENLEKNNIRTCLILPVYVDHVIYGCLGFDCSMTKRPWEISLVRAMMISADIIGAAVQRNIESQERNRLAAAIREFADCVLMTDEQGVILYANPATWNVTGHLPKELFGRKLCEIQSNEAGLPDCNKLLLEAAASGHEWHGDLRSRHKDGSLYDESVAVIPVKGEDGRVNGFCIIKRDQTEKKRLESIAEAANLMENVGFVFSGIRHELANPLNSLKMAISVLRRQLDSLGPEKIKEFLDRAKGEIGRMEYLLCSLKNFNLLEEQKPVPVDLAAFVEQFGRLHEQDLREKGIRLELSVQGPLMGLVDERALHQIMLNLLTNSVNALKKTVDPVISISLERRKAQCVQLRFQDNGCGFSPQVKKQLFTPFFTTRLNGTGLGLTIVKKMLTAMRCTVAMDGQEGKGAWVVVTIPEAQSDH